MEFFANRVKKHNPGR